MRSDNRTPVSIRIGAQRDIDAGVLTPRQIADKYDIRIASVHGWMYGRTPQWVIEAMRVKPIVNAHVMPGITREMLTAGRARPARVRP